MSADTDADDLKLMAHRVRAEEENYQFLLAMGLSHELACQRLGRTPKTMERTRQRRAEREDAR